jgi:hypothetical protein
MNLLHIYRLALTEGLTAKQAGAKYNVNHCSLAKCKTRYNLPTLKNEWDAGYEEDLGKLSDQQLLKYHEMLMLPKNSKSVRELNVCKLLIQKRKLCLK